MIWVGTLLEDPGHLLICWLLKSTNFTKYMLICSSGFHYWYFVVLQNVFLTGSSASFPKFKERMEVELRAIRPFQSIFNVNTASKYRAYFSLEDCLKLMQSLGEIWCQCFQCFLCKMCTKCQCWNHPLGHCPYSLHNFRILLIALDHPVKIYSITPACPKLWYGW
jgi:hypothetical protein